MNFKDDTWIKGYCEATFDIQKELLHESGLSCFLKEEDVDFFLKRITQQKLETILKIINNPDLFGYLYNKSSFIYNYLLSEIFKPFTDYNKRFKSYLPLLPDCPNTFKIGRKNDYWFQLFAESSIVIGKDEVDLRCCFLTESKLSLILNLSAENAGLFFKLIDQNVLIRILKILHDPQLIGYIYNEKSFIYNYIRSEFNFILSRMEGLKHTYVKNPQPQEEDMQFVNNVAHNELWFDAFANSRIYRSKDDKEYDLREIFFDESNLNLLVNKKYLANFLKGIALQTDDFKVLLRTVHNSLLIEELKTDNSLVRGRIESILKEALGLNVYEMPIVEFAKKQSYKYSPDDFLSMDIGQQYTFFESTGLNIFLKDFTEREITMFLKQMSRHKESFKNILEFIDSNKELLEDSTSEIYKQAYEMLFPFFQMVFGSVRFTDDSQNLNDILNNKKNI